MTGILELLGISIPMYVWVGILLIIVGIMIGTFMPFYGREMGMVLVIVGLIMAVGFTMLKDLFNDPNFQIGAIIVVSFIVIIFILFPDLFRKKK